jgi:hypothetical protein
VQFLSSIDELELSYLLEDRHKQEENRVGRLVKAFLISDSMERVGGGYQPAGVRPQKQQEPNERECSVPVHQLTAQKQHLLFKLIFKFFGATKKFNTIALAMQALYYLHHSSKSFLLLAYFFR